MKSNHVKKVILGLLAILLIYIWWGNIQTIYRSSESYSTNQVTSDTTPIAKSSQQLSYMGVKVNPFYRPNNTPDKAAKPRTKPVEKKPPPKLSEVARLTGIVEKGTLSQAVIMTNDTQTFVLSLQDTLVYWYLNEVEPTFAVFKQGKFYDTLWLEIIQR